MDVKDGIKLGIGIFIVFPILLIIWSVILLMILSVYPFGMFIYLILTVILLWAFLSST